MDTPRTMQYQPSLEEYINSEARSKARQTRSRVPKVINERFISACAAKWEVIPAVKEMLDECHKAQRNVRHVYDPSIERPGHRLFRRAAKVFDLDASGTAFRNPFADPKHKSDVVEKEKLVPKFANMDLDVEPRTCLGLVEVAPDVKPLGTDIIVGCSMIEDSADTERILTEAIEQNWLSVVREYWRDGLDELPSVSSVQQDSNFDAYMENSLLPRPLMIKKLGHTKNPLRKIDMQPMPESYSSLVASMAMSSRDGSDHDEQHSHVDLVHDTPFEINEPLNAFYDAGVANDMFIKSWLDNANFDETDHIARKSISDYSGSGRAASLTSETPLFPRSSGHDANDDQERCWEKETDDTAGSGSLELVYCGVGKMLGFAANLVMRCLGSGKKP